MPRRSPRVMLNGKKTSLLQELRLAGITSAGITSAGITSAGITSMDEASRFLKEVFWPVHNERFARPAEEAGPAFVPFAGQLEEILCVQHERQVSNDDTIRDKGLAWQIPARLRRAVFWMRNALSWPWRPGFPRSCPSPALPFGRRNRPSEG